ncbi:ATP-binding protein [Paracoccus caeni]|uniref:ATP-binding protein n=1 Tax=Paracoccus caeni TaxID=657651 RepID=A0A934S988_9RHOB|nr:ATP-binding protein [Paracoccus caeni]MBK4214715.1 ATP-binding protein [Paracoccus caeni]
MTFIALDTAGALAELRALHYNFPRSRRLREALSWMLTDYYAKAMVGRPFEARGLLVTGPSRVGKTDEIRRVLSQLDASGTGMPDGRPARIVSVMLDGKTTWKDLGLRTLNDGLKYVATGRMTQRDIWARVSANARAQGIVGIHYDECQHIFTTASADSRAIILDSFKTLLKQPDWPMMLILSGVENLVDHVNSEEQLRFLLRPVVFGEICLHKESDLDELHMLCDAYAEKAGFEFKALYSLDFYRRLSCAAANRWGLVIELLMETLVLAQTGGVDELTLQHFCTAFTQRADLREGFSPFSIDEYERVFEAAKVVALFEKKGKNS